MIASLNVGTRSLALVLSLAALAAPGRAAEASAANTAPVPVLSNDTAVQDALRELDRFLESNPKLQETLQANVDQILQQSFIEQHPEWRAELQKKPEITTALKTEQNFLIHRSVARAARRPIVRQDLAMLDHFLEAHPDIRTEVKKRPRLLVDTDYLMSHPALAKFYQENPALSSILFERQEKRDARKAGAAKAQQ